MSDLINCGVYVFTPEIFSAIQDVSTHREDRGGFFRLHMLLILGWYELLSLQAFHIIFFFFFFLFFFFIFFM